MIGTLLCIAMCFSRGQSPVAVQSPISANLPAGYFIRWFNGEVDISGDLWQGTDLTELLGLLGDDPSHALKVHFGTPKGFVASAARTISSPYHRVDFSFKPDTDYTDQASSLTVKVAGVQGQASIGIGVEMPSGELFPKPLAKGTFSGGIFSVMEETHDLLLRIMQGPADGQADLYALTLNLRGVQGREKSIHLNGLVALGKVDSDGAKRVQLLYDPVSHKMIDPDVLQGKTGDLESQISRFGTQICGNSWGPKNATFWVYDFATMRKVFSAPLPCTSAEKEDLFGDVKWHCDGSVTTSIGDASTGAVKLTRTFQVYKPAMGQP